MYSNFRSDVNFYDVQLLSLKIRMRPLLPNCYSFNTTSKINDADNTVYIDCFLSYILSEINKKRLSYLQHFQFIMDH